MGVICEACHQIFHPARGCADLELCQEPRGEQAVQKWGYRTTLANTRPHWHLCGVLQMTDLVLAGFVDFDEYPLERGIHSRMLQGTQKHIPRKGVKGTTHVDSDHDSPIALAGNSTRPTRMYTKDPITQSRSRSTAVSYNPKYSLVDALALTICELRSALQQVRYLRDQHVFKGFCNEFRGRVLYAYRSEVLRLTHSLPRLG